MGTPVNRFKTFPTSESTPDLAIFIRCRSRHVVATREIPHYNIEFGTVTTNAHKIYEHYCPACADNYFPAPIRICHICSLQMVRGVNPQGVAGWFCPKPGVPGCVLGRWYLVDQRIATAVWVMSGEISANEVLAGMGRKREREEVVDYEDADDVVEQGREKVRKVSGLKSATRTLEKEKARFVRRKAGYGHGPPVEFLDPNADVGSLNLAMVETDPQKIWANITTTFGKDPRQRRITDQKDQDADGLAQLFDVINLQAATPAATLE